MFSHLLQHQITFGKGYLIYEHEKNQLYSLLKSYQNECCNCLLLTRNEADNFSDIFQETQICHYNTIKLNKGNSLESDYKDLDYVIQLFCSEHNKSVVILDRTDYLLEKYSFYHFMNTIYFIHDVIVNTNAMLFVIIHRALLNETENLLLQKELQFIQYPITHLNNSLLDLLNFLYHENNLRRVVDYKTIKNRLHLTYPTVRKRIKQLEQNGLIKTEMNGRSKHIIITEKGEMILK